MINRKIDLEGMDFEVQFHDVETLNNMALKDGPDMVKVSYHAYLFLHEGYALLDSGSAMGIGNGPLLIARKPYTLEDIPRLTVAIPGKYTTAHLLLQVAAPPPKQKRFMLFSEIENAIITGVTDAGVIIHENRFTYAQKGLLKIADLGEYWETHTGSPIPLGGILAKKNLGPDLISALNRIMHRSVAYAIKHPLSAMPFVRKYAQEMDEKVMQQHIQLYVNDFTLCQGPRGEKAIACLKRIAKERGIIP
jgi:1,4-dihydroxy-6-naphthoate synthase